MKARKAVPGMQDHERVFDLEDGTIAKVGIKRQEIADATSNRFFVFRCAVEAVDTNGETVVLDGSPLRCSESVHTVADDAIARGGIDHLRTVMDEMTVEACEKLRRLRVAREAWAVMPGGVDDRGLDPV